tara:strand:+ start:163 stop:465 length:303 start_codon:yes stop_codon:yes gene_type:complete
MFKLLMLICVLTFAGCAQANHQRGSKIPQIAMPDMPLTIFASAICHYYTDHGLFTKKLEKINQISDAQEKNSRTKDLQYKLMSECVVNLQDVINNYKNSF